MSDISLIDRATLAQLKEDLGGDHELLAELVDDFVRDTPTILDEMRQSITDGDLSILLRTAHTLKSTSAVLGAASLAELAHDLEIATHNAPEDTNVAGFSPAVETICTLFEQVGPAMQAVIAEDDL